jgi:hypothetical protein
MRQKTFIIKEEFSRKLPDGSRVSDDFILDYNNFIHHIKNTFYNIWEIPSGIKKSYKAIIEMNIDYSGWVNIDELSFQTNFIHPQEYEMQESIANLLDKIAYNRFVLPDFIKSQIHESNRADYTFPFSFEIDSGVVARAKDRLKAES